MRRCLCQQDLLRVHSCYDRPFFEHVRVVIVVVWQKRLILREPEWMLGLLGVVGEGDVAIPELWLLIIAMV